MDADARRRESVQVPQAGAAVGIAQHFGTQVGVGGVYRHVQRRDAHPDDAVGVLVAEIGHSDIVAQQKGQPGVVILEIQAPAHPPGQLVDKAEHAPVGAALLGVHQIGLELQAQVLALLLAQLHRAPGAAGALQLQGQAGVIGVKFIVHHIVDGVAADGQKRLPHLQTGLIRRRMGVYPGDDGRHRPPPVHDLEGPGAAGPALSFSISGKAGLLGRAQKKMEKVPRPLHFLMLQFSSATLMT